MLAGLRDLQASEDPQDQAVLSIVETLAAAARGQPENALRHARGTLAYADAVGISFECLRWAWPLAARAAYELSDSTVTRELLALLDSYPPGHLSPMLRAERELVRARLAAQGDDQAAEDTFASAISALRELSTPYHLAHGLLDQAEHLIRLGGADAAMLAIGEARDIARRLSCQPLLDRAITVTSAAQARVRH
jgi:hypothetical protein